MKFKKYFKKRKLRRIADFISLKADYKTNTTKIQEISKNPNFKDSESNKQITCEVALIREQLKRNYEFFGDEGMKKIINSFVIVVGIGGVGR